jgi:hypothetical protein
MKPYSKWERLLELDAKPRTLEDQLVEEAAKLLARELAGSFPPETGGFELSGDEARFAPLYAEPRTRPAEGVFRAAFQLARLELLREVEQIDLYMRQQRYLPLAPSERDKLSMLFLARWMTEQMLALKESLRTRLARARLAEILDRAERALFGPPS